MYAAVRVRTGRVGWKRKKGVLVGGDDCTRKKKLDEIEEKDRERTYTPPHFVASPDDIVAADEHAHAIAEMGDADDGVVRRVVVLDLHQTWDRFVRGALCVVPFWGLGGLGQWTRMVENGEEGGG